MKVEKKIIYFLLLLIGGMIAACSPKEDQGTNKEFSETFSIEIINPLDVSRENTLVFIPATAILEHAPAFNQKAFVVLDGDVEVPSQFNSHDQDKNGIVVVLDKLAANETRQLQILFAQTGSISRTYAKRTQAELSHKTGGHFENREYIGGEFKNVDFLRVPPEHKDHSWFIRYEGPGWESDKVGFRFYLDQRNATDVFGKVTPDMVLQNVGLDGFDSYHEKQAWGMDVMKVGKSLGVGSIGSFNNGKVDRVEKTDSVDCRIVENGNEYSSILTNYYGWNIGNKKHNVKSRISIHAGTRLSHQQLTLTNQPENICTGIVKDKNSVVISSNGSNNSWAYLATYGKQSLNNPADELGLAVFYNPTQAIETTEDEFSHVITLKPNDGKVEYYFTGAWVLEPNGIKDETQFRGYLHKVALELANPLKVSIKR
jgi:hypothetical protein